jgi:hypothetical protein
MKLNIITKSIKKKNMESKNKLNREELEELIGECKRYLVEAIMYIDNNPKTTSTNMQIWRAGLWNSGLMEEIKEY